MIIKRPFCQRPGVFTRATTGRRHLPERRSRMAGVAPRSGLGLDTRRWPRNAREEAGGILGSLIPCLRRIECRF